MKTVGDQTPEEMRRWVQGIVCSSILTSSTDGLSCEEDVLTVGPVKVIDSRVSVDEILALRTVTG